MLTLLMGAFETPSVPHDIDITNKQVKWKREKELRPSERGPSAGNFIQQPSTLEKVAVREKKGHQVPVMHIVQSFACLCGLN